MNTPCMYVYTHIVPNLSKRQVIYVHKRVHFQDDGMGGMIKS